jgi:AcrR family transcriptional regulator
MEQGFDNLTVSQLTARAQINRATFYRHYRDKYDLAERLTELLFADVAHIATTVWPHEPHKATQALFEHVAEYADFYRAMLRPGGIPGFGERIRADVAQQLDQFWGVDEAASFVPRPALVRYLAGGQVAFVQWWLEAGMPCSAEEAAAYLLALHGRGGAAERLND